MRAIKRLAWSLGLLFAFGLLVITGSEHLQRFVAGHASAPFHVLLLLILAIPGSLVTLAAAYLIEGLFVGWRESSLKTLGVASGSVRLDMLSMALDLVTPRLLGYALSLGLLYFIETHSAQGAAPLQLPLPESWGIQVVCLLLLQSFINYWVHRLEHAVPALWALHQFHHSADRMTILTSHRQTELSKRVEQVMEGFPLVFLFAATVPAMPKSGAMGALLPLVLVYFLYRTFIRVNQYLVHSSLTTDYGWIGRWLLVSPRMHRLHHARDAKYHDKNFTFDLVIWDRIFGTYATCSEAEVRALPLGLDDNPFRPKSAVTSVLRDYFLTPYVVFWRALSNGFRAWVPARLGGVQSIAALPGGAQGQDRPA